MPFSTFGRALFAALIAAIPATVIADDEDGTVRIVGAYVNVGLYVDDHDFTLLAKVDTGADSTSIDARNIEEFEEDGDRYVRFEVPLGDDDERMALETRVVDSVTIIGAGDDREERLVVEMDVCVGDLRLETEVNLADREGLNYRLLVGREYLVRGGFLVNPAQETEVEPACDDRD